MRSTSASGTRAAIRVPSDPGELHNQPPGVPLDADGPALEVADNELLSDDGDYEPRSVERPSVTGLLPVRARSALTTAASSDRVLHELLRTTQFLNAAVQGACEHSELSVRELESLDSALHYQVDDYRRLYQRVQELEVALRDAEAASARERQRLTTEQDAFIAYLFTEHEETERALRARLADQERLNRELTDRLARLESDPTKP